MMAPSIKSLKEHFDQSRFDLRETDYRLIRWITTGEISRRVLKQIASSGTNHSHGCYADDAMDALDFILGGHGVEHIKGNSGNGGRYWMNTVALYINFGDSYDATVLYEVENDRFVLTSWGDWVERNERRLEIR